MTTLDISVDDLASAVTFLEQFLSVKLPQYDFSKGTANRDIAINSIAYVVAFVRKEAANVQSRQSLLKLSQVDPDDSVDELVDEILSDWFISRKTGRSSSGLVTLRFKRRDIGTLVLTANDTFTKGSVDFFPTNGTVSITSADLVANVDNLGVTFYTATLALTAVLSGDTGDIDPGVFTNWPQISPYLTTVQSYVKFSGGKSTETSAEMIQRSKSAITVRDLNTTNSIKTVLSDTFPQVLEVVPLGYGDPEFLRDRLEILHVSGSRVVIHRGSMVDAYVKFPVEFNQVLTGLTVVEGVSLGLAVPAVIPLPATPLYKIRSLTDTTVDPVQDVPFTVYTTAIDTWNSSRQVAYLSVGSEYLGLSPTITLDGVTGYAEVQAFVEDQRNRLITADLLVKASYAMYLKFNLGYYRSATNTVDTAAAATKLQAFIHGRAMGEAFRVSEIAEQFTTAYPGNVLQYPFIVVGEILLPNGKSLIVNYTDKITVPEKYAFDPGIPDVLTPLFPGDAEPEGKTAVILSDLQVSQRTLRYVASLSDITFTAN